jgi:hypothetical protein
MESICLLPSTFCRLPTAFERSSGLRPPLHSRSCECAVFALDTRPEML